MGVWKTTSGVYWSLRKQSASVRTYLTTWQRVSKTQAQRFRGRFSYQTTIVRQEHILAAAATTTWPSGSLTRAAAPPIGAADPCQNLNGLYSSALPPPQTRLSASSADLLGGGVNLFSVSDESYAAEGRFCRRGSLLRARNLLSVDLDIAEDPSVRKEALLGRIIDDHGGVGPNLGCHWLLSLEKATNPGGHAPTGLSRVYTTRLREAAGKSRNRPNDRLMICSGGANYPELLCAQGGPDATDVRHGVPVLRGDFTLIGQGDAELLEQPASFKPDVPIQEMNRDELATQIFILGLTGRDPKEQFTSTRHISRKDGRTSDHQPTGRAGRHSRSQSKLRRSPDCSKRFDCGNPAEKNKSPDGWENFDFENPAAGALVAPVPERSFFNSG
ncbi:hypothetical protein Bbelb_226850 [Branchiostoma belcheri]|nr:hypothetical protein Bbelb_226850 [Branchiostoma belcheri]